MNGVRVTRRIPDETIQEIRERVDIVSLIQRYIELKPAGRNTFKGLCPFHNEKTPSFHVNQERGGYHCFGCEAGGDGISFLMEHEGRTFPEAARMLAEENGIEIAEAEGSGEPGLANQILAANEVAQAEFRRALSSAEGSSAREYLETRGVDAESIEKFGIGFAPDRWDTVERALSRASIPATIGETAGLIKSREQGKGHYDFFRGRIIFPIHDVRGRIVAFGGRALGEDQQPKYLNSPETPVFHKRRALYGFPHALEPIRRAARVIVCEGYFDRVALHRAGLGEGLATCGTALSSDHGKAIRRRTREVVLLFDGDGAGQKAMERALETLLPEGLRVRAAALPQGEDPDSVLLSRGASVLEEIVSKAPDAIEILLHNALATGCSTPAERSDVVARVAPLIARVTDPVERVEHARRLAISVGTDVRAVEAVMRTAARSGNTAEAAASALQNPVRRTSDEERHLRGIVGIVSRHAHVAKSPLRSQMQKVLPEGAWKSLLSCLFDAADAGQIDGSGGVDFFAVSERLDEETRKRLSGLQVEETPELGLTAVENMLFDHIRWFENHRLGSKGDELVQRSRDAGVDEKEVLAETQRLIEEKRIAQGLVSDPAS
jgi:DNA primase catalytic core